MKYYYAMIVSLCLRLFWALFFEPIGMEKVIANHPDSPVAKSLKVIVYSQIVIIIVLLILSLTKKFPWVYKINFVVGIILSCLIIYMPIAGLNPGVGPYFVIPFSLAVAIFSYLTMKNANQLNKEIK